MQWVISMVIKRTEFSKIKQKSMLMQILMVNLFNQMLFQVISNGKIEMVMEQ